MSVKEMSANTYHISAWIDWMAADFGGTVYGKGRVWDWGQALCVEQYGDDPNTWPSEPTNTDVERADRWRFRGEWPLWVAEALFCHWGS